MPPEGASLSRPEPSKGRHLRTRVWGAGRLLVLAVALSVTFAVFFLTAIRVANRAREVKVPDVRGKSVTDATALLADAGLVLKIERRADPQVPADHVLAQEPAPGAVLRRQRAVRLRVSDGKRDPTVPSVVGSPERTAEIVLSQEKIEIAGRAEIHQAGLAAGTVIAQDPPAKGQATKVSLLVNRGDAGESYVMPDTIGALSSRVVDILRRRGFRVTVGAEVPYPGLPAGVVLRQTPQAGFQVSYGETVVLEVSR